MVEMTRKQLEAVVTVLDSLADSFECCTGNHPRELHKEANKYRAQLAAQPPAVDRERRLRGAISHSLNVLGKGKCPECTCQGCEWERQEAVETLTAALADQPPPDPREAALEKAEKVLAKLAEGADECRRVIDEGWVGRDRGVTGNITFGDVIDADDALAAIRAARGKA